MHTINEGMSNSNIMMMGRGGYFIVCVLLTLIVGVVNGNVTDPGEVQFARSDSRYVDGLLPCACSPSGRGSVEGAVTVIQEVLEQIKGVHSGDGSAVEKKTTSFTLAATALSGCSQKNGYEACINVAANMRARYSSMPPLCKHDSITGKNAIPLTPASNTIKTLGPCSTDKNYASAGLGGVIAPSKAPATSTKSAISTPSKKAPVKPSASASKKPKPSASNSPKPKPSTTSTAAPSASPTASISYTPIPSASPTKTLRPCIATSWLSKRGLMDKAIYHGGEADVLCIAGLPCGTEGHILRQSDGTLRTFREICSERTDCTRDKTEVSQLSHEFNWSVFVSDEGDLALTSLSAHPYSTTWSVSRRVAWLADRMNKSGYGRVCNMIAMIPHRVHGAVRYAKWSAVGNGRS